MLCTRCDAQITVNAKFCPQCGTAAPRPKVPGQNPPKVALEGSADVREMFRIGAWFCALAALVHLVDFLVNPDLGQRCCSAPPVRSSRADYGRDLHSKTQSRRPFF
jgi:hypothetical protein